jgi:very-short-patch-repair endonuclease
MSLKILKPKQALNKAFLKVKPNRNEIEHFKSNLIKLIDQSNDIESEEFHKNLVIDFLKKTYYDPNHYINTKGRNDLVIHTGDKAKSTVGVIIEAKKPTNKSEMLSVTNINYKAFQELVLYYLRERITHKNLEVKHLIVTNINEWFIFDAQTFDRHFAQNKALVKQFEEFEGGRLSETRTDFFYKHIAEPEIEKVKEQINFTYFDIRTYDKPLRNEDKKDDAKLIALYKLLSPEHLLKLPFANDSNSLDKRFYGELLHIIGLTESKEGGKKLIGRSKAGERNSGSILEDAIIQLDSLDKLGQLEKPSQYGSTTEERLFNVGLELSITWINRVLFLKLLEAQLITYHNLSRDGGKGDTSYAFLNKKNIRDWDDLNSLFFQVLAKKQSDRNEDVREAFAKVPYLNSSLFEPTAMEQRTIMINFLKNEKPLPVISSTVLKNEQGKKLIGSLTTLEYLFKFLDAYDFASEGSEEIQEDNKTLINASVLGLIFEKINGYKDGSFFTPGFITMYMCRETIRRAVLQKFKESVINLTPNPSGIKNLTPNPSPKKRGELAQFEPQRQKINPKLLENAREMRKNPTKAEDFLWQLVRNRQLLGYKFRRQHPISQKFILDFFCNELMLGIELDGGYHQEIGQTEYDEGRSYELKELGITILRFSNEEAIWETEKIFERVKLHSEAIHPSHLGEGSGVRELNSLEDVYDIIGPNELISYEKANEIINSIKICDPAVGSGHFLVSALNEIIAVKNDLKILQDRSGKRLKEYQVEVVNDELIVTDEDGELFEYHPTNKESQRIQETLFHEKQTIIENCLFGVDINPNSVKICRLRLWIELLKSAYYKSPSLQTSLPEGERLTGSSPKGEAGVRELETLPNIDINIKCGNSLVSRFPLDEDLSQALKKSKFSIDAYRIAVDRYRNAESKEEKREMEGLILEIKQSFSSTITMNNPVKKKLDKLANELYHRFTGTFLFEPESEYGGKKIEEKRKKEQIKLETEIEKLSAKIEEIKDNKIYHGSFEWRFEFPEILNDDGDYIGFDAIIGNPPYIRIQELQQNFPEFVEHINKVFESTGKGNYDIYIPFIELGYNLLKKDGSLAYIMPHKFLNANYGSEVRGFLKKTNFPDKIIHFGSNQVFEDATTYTGLFFMSKKMNLALEYFECDNPAMILEKKAMDFSPVALSSLTKDNWIFLKKDENKIFDKLKNNGVSLESLTDRIFQGLKTSADKIFILRKISENEHDYLVYSEQLERELSLEKTYLFPLIKGGNSRAYTISEPELLILFPYENGNLTHWSALKETAPMTAAYLTENKAYLEKRESGKFKGESWFQYGRHQAIETIKNPKIFTPDIAPSSRFSLDKIGQYMFTGGASGGYGIIPKSGVSFNFLLGILNSKVANWYIQLSSTQMRGGWYSFESRYIKSIPLPSISSSSQLDDLVESLLQHKGENEELINQIDQLVYEMYGLSKEEIGIVERNSVIEI